MAAGAFLCVRAAFVPQEADARELKISHQFAEADARHELAVEFAKRVEKATNGELERGRPWNEIGARSSWPFPRSTGA
ncbi:MAG: hypothetical protein HY900_00860 [Deltaproteobacteria bacterium]|nr:hypothetical protein [Deltaproteobacteria bacterium]